MTNNAGRAPGAAAARTAARCEARGGCECARGRVFLISRLVGPRPPPRGGSGPLCRKQKQTSVTSVTRAAGEILGFGDLKVAVSLEKLP